MPVPTEAANFKVLIKGGAQNRILRYQNGAAPFDIYGYTMEACAGFKVGTFIGAELKNSYQHKTSLPIQKESGGGGGIQIHQLYALEEAAVNGCISRILWRNEREIGLLDEKGVIEATYIFNQYLKTSGSNGRASIPWEKFQKIGYQQVGSGSAVAWLPVRKIDNVFRTSTLP